MESDTVPDRSAAAAEPAVLQDQRAAVIGVGPALVSRWWTRIRAELRGEL